MKDHLAPDHLRFAVLACDVVLFTIRNGQLAVRCINVNRPPHFQNIAGLPGGLLLPEETAENALERHVLTRAHIDTKKIYFEQLYTFSTINRDPRGRVVAVAYLALVPWEKLSQDEQKDTADSFWAPVYISPLAYDHDEMLAMAIERLRSRIAYTTIISKLLPAQFTLTELEQAYTHILNTKLDKRNFRKKILKLGILKEIKGKKSKGKFRPASLYTFTSKSVKEVSIL